jgi:carbamoyl-phosphate synthase large subunit
MIRFYVSSIGGDIAQSIVKIISECVDSCLIIGTDLNAENSGKALVDVFEISPAADDINYLSWLSYFLGHYSIDYFLPVNEKELHALASMTAGELEQMLGGSKLIWAGRDSVKIFEDKIQTSNFLNGIGVKTPKHYLTHDDVRSNDYPVIVKPNLGAGSRNMFKCNTKLELDAALRFVSSPIIQKHIGDAENEFTAGVFRNVDGDTKVINFRRKLLAGATGWAMVVPNLEIEAICKKIASSISLTGSINVQFRIDEGEPSVFEVNGRFSSTVYMRHLLGFQDLLWSLGLRDSFPIFDHSRIAGKETIKLNNFRIWK